jgi:uncharacterized protein
MQTRTFGRATIRFYGDLADLARTDPDGHADVPVDRSRSVKDAIESCGVPHTEVDLVLVGGRSVGFGAPVEPGDRVAAYPPFVSLDVPSHVRPAPMAEPRFVLDVHLGRLAERLRLLGFDTLYANDLDDDDLAVLSVAGPRWLLTRDRGLLMRRTVTHGYLVRSTDPATQAFEAVRRFRLQDRLAPYTRCARCNGVLEPVGKAAVEHLLEPATRAEHDTFSRCGTCGQVYWPGTHLTAIEAFVEQARAVAGRG